MINRFHVHASLLALLMAGCAPAPPARVDTQVQGHRAEVETHSAQRERLGEIASLALGGMTKTLQMLDPDRPGSDLNKLNRVAQSIRLQISRDTFRLLDLAHHFSIRTGGAYDPTALPLEKLWGLPSGRVPKEEPDPELIAGTLQSVGSKRLEIFDQGAVAFTTPGTLVGLRQISLAYAADLAAVDLRRRGFTDVRIRLDTTHRILGQAAPGQPWQVPVENPFATNTPLGMVRLTAPHPALVVLPLRAHTITIGSNTYGHIINPLTGRPAEGTALAAVLGPSATMAYALAHALVVRGVEQASELLEQFPKCEAVVVPDRQPAEVWCSDGFAAQLSLSTNTTLTIIPLPRGTVSPADAAPAEPAAPAP